MNKQDLIQLLTDNEMESLFEQLRARQRHRKEQVLLESQWKDLQSRQRSGMISYDQANLEAARLRNGLLELIEMSFVVPAVQPINSEDDAPFTTKRMKPAVIAAIIAGAGLLIYLLVFQLPPMLKPGNGEAEATTPSTMLATSDPKPAKSRSLNISAAEPITLSPGDFQYERVYSVIEGKVERIGGGQLMVTLKVGLDFKGVINAVLSNDDFRLVAAELRGPLAPSNFLSELVDSKSYGEGEVKFEISDAIKRFSIIIEDKPMKKWDFTIE